MTTSKLKGCSRRCTTMCQCYLGKRAYYEASRSATAGPLVSRGCSHSANLLISHYLCPFQSVATMVIHGQHRCGLTTEARISMMRLFLAALLAGIAYLAFGLWGHNTIVNTALTAVVFLLSLSRRWGRAIYFFMGALSYTYISTFLSYSLLITIIASIFWPVTAAMGAVAYVRGDRTDFIDQASEPAPTPSVSDEKPDEESITTPASSETPAGQQQSTSPEAQRRVRVKQRSSVRSGPDTTFPVIFSVQEGEIYLVLEENIEGTWYRIETGEGATGWIGSTRVELDTP